MKAGRQIYVQEDSIISVAKEERNVLITHLFYNSNDNTFAIVTADHNIIIHSLETFGCIKQVNCDFIIKYSVFVRLFNN